MRKSELVQKPLRKQFSKIVKEIKEHNKNGILQKDKLI